MKIKAEELGFLIGFGICYLAAAIIYFRFLNNNSVNIASIKGIMFLGLLISPILMQLTHITRKFSADDLDTHKDIFEGSLFAGSENTALMIIGVMGVVCGLLFN